MVDYIKHPGGIICCIIRKDQQPPVSNGADSKEVTLTVATDTQLYQASQDALLRIQIFQIALSLFQIWLSLKVI